MVSDSMYRVKEGILGCAIGDALGTVTKNQSREYLIDHPVLKMTPSLKKGLPKGSWGDTTSLTLATMYAITKKGMDYDYIAENCVSWFTSNKFCSVDEAFDIGKTTLKSLVRFTQRKCPAYECGEATYNDNGNSALKMMFPLAFYFTANKENKDIVFDTIQKVASITHKHEISICACYIYVHFLMYLLNGNNKYAAIKNLKHLDYSMFSNATQKYFSRLLIGNIQELNIDEIKSSHFVVDTLEATLWCFLKSDNYRDCVVAATNIGGDTAVIGALAGGMASIYYGTNNIPKDWMDNIRKKDYIVEIAEEYDKYLRLRNFNQK